MSYQPIDIEEMRSKLLTLDQAREILAPTEGLAEYEFATDGSNEVRFEFPDGWNSGLDSREDFDSTTARVTIDGTELALTKNGALEAASTVGLTKSFVKNVPGSLIEPLVNYQYRNGANGKSTLKLLASRNGGLAFTRGTISPFSNEALLDAVVTGISEKYDTDDILVDYKLHNSLNQTNMRIIVPSSARSIGSARAQDAGSDPWSLGVEISNSVTGNGSLELTGYLFAYWCTNGMTMQRASSGRYRRRPTATPDDAYAWAHGVVDDVFNDLEPELQLIEHLPNIPLEGELNETVGRLFERFEVPVGLRDRVISNLVESDDLSAYGLISSVTAVANDADITANEVAALLRAGGSAAVALETRCPSCHRM